jgi:hypothetical protein
VKKNRFDGTLGFLPLFFEHKSARYSETPVDASKAAAKEPSQGGGGTAAFSTGGIANSAPAGSMFASGGRAGNGSESEYMKRRSTSEHAQKAFQAGAAMGSPVFTSVAAGGGGGARHITTHKKEPPKYLTQRTGVSQGDRGDGGDGGGGELSPYEVGCQKAAARKLKGKQK